MNVHWKHINSGVQTMVKLKHRNNLLLEPWHLEGIPFHFWQVTNLPSSVLSALEALCSSMVEPSGINGCSIQSMSQSL
jgi:hypothetical protein